MDYLIDTHVCIWAISEKKNLSLKVKDIIEDTNEKIFLSQASIFEIAIKLKIGKLPDFNVPLAQFVESIVATGIEILPIKNEHTIAYADFDFPQEHRDPFDRLIIATASFEKMAVISKDEKFKLYTDRLKIVW